MCCAASWANRAIGRPIRSRAACPRAPATVDGGTNAATSALAGLIASNAARRRRRRLAGAAAASAGGQLSGDRRSAERDAAGLLDARLTVQPAPELNAIVVRGTPQAIASIERLITDLDVRRPQVLIEAAIAEITGDDAEALAVQLGTGGAVLNAGRGRGHVVQHTPGRRWAASSRRWACPPPALLGEGFSGNVAIGDDFSILVQALGASTKANLLSTPQITTLDNKSSARFVVGAERAVRHRIDPDRQRHRQSLHHDRAQGCRHHAARPAADQCRRHEQ